MNKKKFAIRKLAVGTASVVIGLAGINGGSLVSANDLITSSEKRNSLEDLADGYKELEKELEKESKVLEAWKGDINREYSNLEVLYIPYEVIIKEDSELEIGKEKILVFGKAGKKEIKKVFKEINGVKSEPEITETILEEKIDEVIVRGTKRVESNNTLEKLPEYTNAIFSNLPSNLTYDEFRNTWGYSLIKDAYFNGAELTNAEISDTINWLHNLNMSGAQVVPPKGTIVGTLLTDIDYSKGSPQYDDYISSEVVKPTEQRVPEYTHLIFSKLPANLTYEEFRNTWGYEFIKENYFGGKELTDNEILDTINWLYELMKKGAQITPPKGSKVGDMNPYEEKTNLKEDEGKPEEKEKRVPEYTHLIFSKLPANLTYEEFRNTWGYEFIKENYFGGKELTDNEILDTINWLYELMKKGAQITPPKGSKVGDMNPYEKTNKPKEETNVLEISQDENKKNTDKVLPNTGQTTSNLAILGIGMIAISYLVIRRKYNK